ncbi:MAG: hypothetical protein LBL94_03540 [Prevotellaceae bacterium]|nr:hypothetical protein [Prevotellaceae bacterium]
MHGLSTLDAYGIYSSNAQTSLVWYEERKKHIVCARPSALKVDNPVQAQRSTGQHTEYG